MTIAMMRMLSGGMKAIKDGGPRDHTIGTCQSEVTDSCFKNYLVQKLPHLWYVLTSPGPKVK